MPRDPAPTIRDWLRQQSVSNARAKYSHRLLKENTAARAAILAQVKKYFDDNPKVAQKVEKMLMEKLKAKPVAEKPAKIDAKNPGPVTEVGPAA